MLTHTHIHREGKLSKPSPAGWHVISFFFFFFNFFLSFFFGGLGLCYRVGFLQVWQVGAALYVVHRLLIAVTSLVAKYGLSGCGTWA